MARSNIAHPLPPIEYLCQCFSYDADTGVLTWLDRPIWHFAHVGARNCFRSRWVGKPVGVLTKRGYLMTSVFGQKITVHRIAWALYYGKEPTYSIDHINGVKDDNRIANLRDVDHATNGLCLVRSRKNTSGFTGITWHKQAGKWLAQMVYQGKHYSLGLHSDINDAVAARQKANKEFGFSESHGQVDPCKVSTASPGRLSKDNTTGHVGIYAIKGTGRWTASIYVNGKLISLGSYDNKEDAIAARKAGEIYYGVADRVLSGSGAPILPA